MKKPLLYYHNLLETNPENLENELNELEFEDPEHYNYVCEKLGLFEDEGEQDEELNNNIEE
jgi:hypothetical protein